MLKFPWKITLAGAVFLAGAVCVFAAPPTLGHDGTMHPLSHTHDQTMHEHDQVMRDQTVMPTSPGQEAFGAIQEIVQILEADPNTDWSKVNIPALREHLIDMNEVTLRAKADEHVTGNGVEIAVTGEGRTRAAIKRMVPAHVHELVALGWNAKTSDLPNGVMLTVTANEAVPLVKLKALGFMGIMVQGSHHQIHHLLMAKGQFMH